MNFLRARLRQFSVPGLTLLRSYSREWLRDDIAAGLVLAAMLVPVGIAYAVASGLPGIHGLYASIVPLLLYALFGPSRILVLGPDSALVALILAVVLPLSGDDPARIVALAGMMAVVSGVVCILVAFAGLGFLTELLSKPVRYGYMNGIALAVLIAQLPMLFGFHADGEGVLGSLAATLQGLLHGDLNGLSLLIGLATLALSFLLKKHLSMSSLLLSLVLVTAGVWGLGLADDGRIAVLGVLPQGLPTLTWPQLQAGDWQTVLLGGCAVAVVSFADISVLSRAYAGRSGRVPATNQEMLALGMANLATGLMQGFPVSGSASRTPVLEAAGARTQLACVFAAVALAVFLYAAPTLLQHVPMSALAAVVMLAALRIFEVKDLLRIRRIQAWEFWQSLVCTVGVLALGVIEGIGLAIAIAVIEFLWDGWRPYSAVLGRVHGLKGYHDISRYPEAREVPGLLLLRWDSPLFFANAEFFQQRVLDLLRVRAQAIRRVVITAEPVTSIDVTSADMLVELQEKLQRAGTELHFAEMKDPVKDKLRRFEVFDRFGEAAFHPTIGSAVANYVRQYAVDWADWEER